VTAESWDERFHQLIRGERRGPLDAAARVGLAGASVGYGTAVALRNQAFDRGWKSIHHTAVPVVSIGNLTVGGTGKTPMVEWIARWYRERDVRVAILSRGYGQAGEGGGVNDEALVLEENLPDVPHLQDPDRATLADLAVEELESQLLVLDDGFQHRRLARDLDVVLLDALDPFGLGWLLPRGLLREPVRSLHRADLAVVTRADLVTPEALCALRARAERHAGPLKWVVTRHAPFAVSGYGVGDEPISTLQSQRVAAFCGIGNPDGFRRTLEPLCGAIAGFRRFPDHHNYKAAEVAELTIWARSLNVDLVLTTQKDLVKLRAATLGGVPLRALRIGLEILEGAGRLEAALAAFLPSRESLDRDKDDPCPTTSQDGPNPST
jgi:tetraacyldisaccharide 4'-kinase